MPLRSIRLAYAIPPLLALLLGFLGLTEVSDEGVLGVSSVVTASSNSGAASNERVAQALQSVAVEHDATILRLVADRAAPTTRRVALVTTAPSTAGEAWLQDGLRDFSRAITTRVRPMTDLVRYDTSGPYGVIGDEAARKAVAQALVSAGFSVSSESFSLPDQLGIVTGVGETWGLVGALTLGCVTLCLVGTVGAPRRSAIRRMNGWGPVGLLLTELSEIRVSLVVMAAAVPLAMCSLWLYNGLAFLEQYVAAVGLLCLVLVAPLVLAHAAGTLIACRAPLAAAIRGVRPPGALVLAAQAARIPAVLLLIAVIFDVVGSAAVVRQGDAKRDVLAAGHAVHLWVTPDPRPGDQSQRYWDHIGAFAGRALDEGVAFLAVAAEIDSGDGRSSLPALIVNDGYLRHQDVRAETGQRITATDDRIGVWLPEGIDVEREPLVRALLSWELRSASERQQRDVGGGHLLTADPYTYPGDSSVASRLRNAVIVVVPHPSALFSDDQLGSWLSTGDIVFRSVREAESALAESQMTDRFSAVVAVGQDAADRARHDASALRVNILALIGTVTVAVLLCVVSTTAHRRRYGRLLFVRVASGVSFARANLELLLAEGALSAVALVSVLNGWWARHPDGSGRISLVDPIARSAAAGGLFAGGAVVLLGLVGMAVITRTGIHAAQTRGKET